MMNILLTGVSSGIGATTAQRLLERGHRVWGTVRKAEDAARLAAHANFTTLVMDVADSASVKVAVDGISDAGEVLHAVVNNAGIAVSGPLETIEEVDYRWQFDVNVFGTLAVCQAALPLLHAAREAGATNVTVVNVSSVSGYVSSPFTSLYSASKFALEALTDGLRRELHPFGIDVVSVAPGPVKTPIWAKAKLQTKAFEGTRYAEILPKLGPYIEATEKSAVVPEVVADTIIDSIERELPRPDRLVMASAKGRWLIKIARQLPKRLQDKLLLKNLEGNKRY